jgi:hypothetical protein
MHGYIAIMLKQTDPGYRSSFLIIYVITSVCISCTRNTIEFGTVPENNYTRLAYIDTVGVRLSTVLTDSFSTASPSSFLLGRYKDPYTGVVSARPFFQLDKPSVLPDIPATAVYDSIVFIIRSDNYYYGDTSRLQTIYIYELSQSIVTGYNDQLYNTSNFPVKPDVLGSRTLRIRPVADDSIVIRLNDSKGSELFNKIKQKHTDVSGTDAFLNYFKGISIATGTDDTTAVYGLLSGAGTLVMRVHYHTTIPDQQRHFVDFPSMLNSLSFNQLLTDRTGTGIVPGISGLTEIPSYQTGNHSFSQPGTGLRLKLGFPSLKGILLTEDYVRLLRAELIIRPAFLSYDQNRYPLPGSLFLAYTDNTNLLGNSVPDSTGGVMYSSPVIDEIYGQNTYYRFNITSYIGQLLQTPANEKYGLYIRDQSETSGLRVDRLVLGTTGHSNYITQLQLSVLIVNK